MRWLQSGQTRSTPVRGDNVAGATGAFYDAEDEEPYLHATSFILNESGKVETAVYSTGSVGRLTAEDALRYTKNLSAS